MSEEKEPTPSKCEFCGRDLILYKDNWICGHGCMKPAVKPKEPTIIISTITESEKQAYFGTSNFPPKEDPTSSEQREFPLFAFAIISGLLISAWTIFLMIIGLLL